ncbi:hypothetical protein BD780_002580 [Clostridium tetanomorphum]|uniref:DUF6916 family protein n=1 Tax=Clostridium tetanomorphum TaxID=1553 RepID=UPI00044F7B40|nr:hypothetical protein [Clostridium tetanomorphum]KAJ50729.1 hypothetical protein CTM_17342 [Clostridium tetanomorphum DSM 665]MBP1862806.1 hypothetical protein [Clostridium tetanomorphum]NRS85355.1 hypothetical protein [Clostridium tetanomorphum]SQC02927.1 Uncharacterised protein [Clostridium tetanomorphum]
MLDNFVIDTFQIGDLFKVFYGEGQYVEITLAKATRGKYRNPALKREPFLWVFKSSKEIWIESGTYKMQQEKVGNFGMFITPTQPLNEEGKFNYYEAVFS